MKFAYQAVDMAGKASSDEIDAPGEAEAADLLRQRGLFVTELRQADGATGAGGKKRKRLGRGKRLKYLAMFTRQLSVLVSSGTPIVQALGSLERQAKDEAWRDVVGGLRAKVEEGAAAAGPEHASAATAARATAPSSAPAIRSMSALTRSANSLPSSRRMSGCVSKRYLSR
ncbi:MAG: type II secretion system F family protein [Actinobacteria bacterium]|nr:type II secretion system F family protein [Actinomycetota bacterium]